MKQRPAQLSAPGTLGRPKVARRNEKLNLQLYQHVIVLHTSQRIEITRFPDRHFWHGGYDKAVVSGILQVPPRASACCVMAHVAGAGMTHPFMAAVADGLSERRIATLRYQFPYMEQGSRRPDQPALAHATVRAAVAAATRLLPSLPLIAGGKSFGGRMTSQAQADAPMPGVRGLVFLGFPLHPTRKPSDDRARHLFQVHIPMLFLQGTRDTLADLQLLRPLVKRLGERATLQLTEGADHSFHVPARLGRTDEQVLAEVLDTLAAWTNTVPHSGLR